MAKAKKIKFMGEANKPLETYLQQDEKVFPRTIRAPGRLWDRLDHLAKVKDARSLNHLVVSALEKICDEEGIS